RISRQRAFLDAPGESRPDWWIVTQAARRSGYGRAIPYRSPADIFREHARPSAFENDGTRAFDIGALAALTDEEYDALAPVQWPLPAGDGGRRGWSCHGWSRSGWSRRGWSRRGWSRSGWSRRGWSLRRWSRVGLAER